MAPGTRTLSAPNLETLGAPRLAELLIEITRGNAAAQRHLRLALADGAGAMEAARLVAKRLLALGRETTRLTAPKIKPLVAELEAQRRTIVETITPSEPHEAFELVWRLVDAAAGVLARSNDSADRLHAAFQAAARDIAPLAQRTTLPPVELATRFARALTADRPGIWHELIPELAPALGAEGLTALRDHLLAWQAQPSKPLPAGRPGLAVWRPGHGLLQAHEFEARRRHEWAATLLRDIADALDDVDAYIAQFDAGARTQPQIAAAIAQRLLRAKRPHDAWQALDHAAASARDYAAPEWEQLRGETLEALGRPAEAQSFRWDRFVATLDPTPLRAHLRHLPDFDDIEAEQRAMAHVLAFPDPHRALAFLVEWPDLPRAAELVLARTAALDGDRHELLSAAAEALADRHPLAATLLRRAMIDFTLAASRSARYRHAARHLRDCRQAATQLEVFTPAPDHQSYERALRTAHARKLAFWMEADTPA